MFKNNINTTNNNGQTPVWIAADNGDTDTIRVLAELGVDVNAPENNGRLPLELLKKDEYKFKTFS